MNFHQYTRCTFANIPLALSPIGEFPINFLESKYISEYEDEQEVLILPYTLFEVVDVSEQTETQPFTIHLQNVHVRDASLLSFITGDIDSKQQ